MSMHAMKGRAGPGEHSGANQAARDARKLEKSVAAIVYDDEAYPDQLFRQIVDVYRARRVAIAGVLQHLASGRSDRRCDVYLEDLASGHRTRLFENRGSEARGCRLDGNALAEATARIERSLDDDPGLLVLNKFGKVEAEGEGLRDLIARAVEADIPVVIGVPARNLEAWRDFAGEFSLELSADTASVFEWLEGLRSMVTPSAGSN